MDLEETTRTVGVPPLIVCGSLDRLTAPELSRRLKELIPESRLDIIEGAGHMLPLETPEALNKKILHFVSAGEATDLH